MDLDKARELLSSTSLPELVTSLKFFKEHGSVSDITSLIPITKHSVPKIKELASHTVGTIIKTRLVEEYDTLAQATREKLGLLLSTLSPQIVKEIAEDAFSTESSKRVRAVQILGLLRKNPQIKTIIAKLVSDRDEKIRATAVTLLAKFIGPDDHSVIMALMHDKDKRVRANTVEALESIKNPRLLPILMRFKKDPINRIRGNVLKAIYNLGNKNIEADLIAMFTTNDNFMIASALWVISQVGIETEEIIDRCGEFFISDNDMVFTNAKNALTRLSAAKAKGYLNYLTFKV